MQKQLLIRITPQLRLTLHALHPRLLQHVPASVWRVFIQACDFRRVDLLVQQILQRWCQVVIVVVAVVAMGVIVVVRMIDWLGAVVMIVRMRHGVRRAQ